MAMKSDSTAHPNGGTTQFLSRFWIWRGTSTGALPPNSSQNCGYSQQDTFIRVPCLREHMPERRVEDERTSWLASGRRAAIRVIKAVATGFSLIFALIAKTFRRAAGLMDSSDKSTAANLAWTREGLLIKHDPMCVLFGLEVPTGQQPQTYIESLTGVWRAMAGNDDQQKAAFLLCAGRMNSCAVLSHLKQIEKTRTFGDKTMRELRWYFYNVLQPDPAIDLFGEDAPSGDTSATLRRLVRQRLLLIHPDKYNSTHVTDKALEATLIGHASTLYRVIGKMRDLLKCPDFSRRLCHIENPSDNFR